MEKFRRKLQLTSAVCANAKCMRQWMVWFLYQTSDPNGYLPHSPSSCTVFLSLSVSASQVSLDSLQFKNDIPIKLWEIANTLFFFVCVYILLFCDCVCVLECMSACVRACMRVCGWGWWGMDMQAEDFD